MYTVVDYDLSWLLLVYCGTVSDTRCW